MAALLVGACAPVVPPTPTPAPAATPAASPTDSPTPPATGHPAPPTPRPTGVPQVALELVADGFEAPLLATGAGDGSGRLFVGEQGGRVWVVRDGVRDPDPFLDLADRIAAGGERGLLGLAFAPGFPADPRLFVHYSDRNGDTVIASYRIDGRTPDRVDPETEAIVLTASQPYPNHNGGAILFDRDGHLLVGLGDGGAGGDPEGRGQRLDTLLGKVLRLDVAGSTGHAIASDNPFAAGGGLPEILHWGLRNPWRMSLDDATGDLWIGDVGQNAWEEVDVARAGSGGHNFGWDRLEGTHCYEPASGCDPSGTTLPVAEYDHGLGCTVVGGVVVRNGAAAVAGLAGRYLFGDYCTGTIWAIDAAAAAPGAATEPVVILESGRTIGSFGTDDDGEAYLLDIGAGEVLRIVGA